MAEEAPSVGLVSLQPEHLTLARPFGRQVAKSANAQTTGKSSLNSCLDQIWREESERDCHVDLPRGAILALRYCFYVDRGIDNDFIEPTSPPCDRCDQRLRDSRSGWGARRVEVGKPAPVSHVVVSMLSCAMALRLCWVRAFLLEPATFVLASSTTNLSVRTSTRTT